MLKRQKKKQRNKRTKKKQAYRDRLRGLFARLFFYRKEQNQRFVHMTIDAPRSPTE